MTCGVSVIIMSIVPLLSASERVLAFGIGLYVMRSR